MSQDSWLEFALGAQQGKRGRLSGMVHHLAGADDARAVCAFFGITDSMTPKEETGLLVRWFGYRARKGPLESFCPNRQKNARRTMHAAVMLIGRWYLESKADRPAAPAPPPSAKTTTPAAPLAIPVGKVALALMIRPARLGVLPAAPVQLPLQRVLDLVDSTLYFRCSLPEAADAREKELGLVAPPGGTTSEGPGDVYVRIDVEDGGDLLTADTLFALKSRLSEKPHRPLWLARQATYTGPAQALRDFHRI